MITPFLREDIGSFVSVYEITYNKVGVWFDPAAPDPGTLLAYHSQFDPLLSVQGALLV